MNKKINNKKSRLFLEKSGFELFCEIKKAMNSDDSAFILRVARKAEKFRSLIIEHAFKSKTAKGLVDCINAECLTALTMRAFDKTKPIEFKYSSGRIF